MCPWFSLVMNVSVRQPKGWRCRMSGMVPLKSWWGEESLWLTLLTRLHIQIVWLTAASQRFSGNPTEMIRVCAISRIVWMVLSDLAFLLGSYGARYVTSVPSSWYMVFIMLDLYVWCLSILKKQIFLLMCVCTNDRSLQ